MISATIAFHPMASEQGGAVPTFSPVFEVADFRYITVLLDIQDAGGTTPTLTVTIEQSMDGQKFMSLDAFPVQSGPTVVKLTGQDFARFIRARYNYGGTDPWFAFSLLGIVRG